LAATVKSQFQLDFFSHLGSSGQISNRKGKISYHSFISMFELSILCICVHTLNTYSTVGCIL